MKFQISSKRRLWGKPWRKQGGPKAGCPGPVWNWATEGYTGLWPVEAAKAARKSISQVGKLSEWVLGWRKPFRILPICTELICFSIIFLIPPLDFNTYYRPWHFSKIFHSQIPTHLSFLLHHLTSFPSLWPQSRPSLLACWQGPHIPRVGKRAAFCAALSSGTTHHHSLAQPNFTELAKPRPQQAASPVCAPFNPVGSSQPCSPDWCPPFP